MIDHKIQTSSNFLLPQRRNYTNNANFMSETRLTCFGVKIHWFVCWSKDSNSGTLRASSHGSDSTPESRLFRVRFNPWEPALTGQIQPVRAGSHGSDSTRESQLSRVWFNLWELALTGRIQPVRVGSYRSDSIPENWLPLQVFYQAHPPVKVNSRQFQF